MSKRWYSFKIFMVLLIALSLVVSAQALNDKVKSDDGKLKFVDGDIIVKFKVVPINNISKMENEVERLGNNGIYRIHSNNKKTDDLIKEYSMRNDVEYVEPNYVYEISLIPDDEYYNLLYGMEKIDAPIAWNTTTGNINTVVAVIDTGINYTHPDLSNNIWSAPTSFTVNVNGIPITCPVGSHGYNAIANSCNPMDDHYHGTHCAGTIGAIGNNSIGVAGVNWNTKIIGAKFLSSGGSGSTSDAIKAIEFLIQVDQQDLADIRILSNSWGGGGYSQALKDEIEKAGANNMLFVAAAGNTGEDADILTHYPAAYNSSNIISVAATDSNDLKASFSTYGLHSVDLGAPGFSIYSTYTRPSSGIFDSYAYLSGTSMATPHVAGAANLLLSVCNFDTNTLKRSLMNNTDQVASMSGRTVTGGRLNIGNAIDCEIPELPPQPNSSPPRYPVAAFVGTPRSGNAPLTVQFTDQSRYIPTSWKWDFENDGIIDSTLQNPSHIYTIPGLYSVKLQVSNNMGSTGLVYVNYTNVTGVTPTPTPTPTPEPEPIPLNAFFTAPKHNGNAPFEVSFIDKSTGNPTSYKWNFGDGSESTLQSPSHIYTNAGSYTVILTISTDEQQSSYTRFNFVKIRSSK